MGQRVLALALLAAAAGCQPTFAALYDAFAERTRKLDGKALVDGMDEGGFDIVDT